MLLAHAEEASGWCFSCRVGDPLSMEFDQAVREILNRADIVRLVSEYVQLRKNGQHFWGLCPMHAEKTPSFSVNPSKRMYYCFGCHRGGNAINFLAEVAGLTKREAIERLAAETGVQLPEQRPSDPAEEAAARERSEIMKALVVAQEYFVSSLYAPEGERARNYLDDRGVDEQTAAAYGLGFGGAGGGLIRMLEKRGVPMQIAEAAGLVLPSTRGSGYYERFRGRVICPVFNNDGAAVAFSARILPGDEDGPKYLNSPETAVFRKGSTVFGLYQARQAIRQSRHAIIVEGNFDVISLAASGVLNVVAPLGTALTPQQVRQLARFAGRVTLFFDGDEAGYKASRRSVAILLEEGVEGYIVSTPSSEDPDSMARRGGRPAIESAVADARPMVTWLVDSLVGVFGRSPHGIRQVIEEVSGVLAAEKDRIRYGLYREEVARILGMDVRELKGILGGRQTAVPGRGPEVQNSVEVSMLKLLALNPALIDTLLDRGGREYFQSEEASAVLNRMFDLYASGGDLEGELIAAVSEQGTVMSAVASVIAMPTGISDVQAAFDETFLQLRIAFLNRRLNELKQAMRGAVDEDAKMRLLVDVTAVERQLKEAGPSLWRFRGTL